MVDNSPLYLVILAAGKGTRMKSNRAKVLHEVFYAPMLHHVLQALAPLHAEKSIIILGHQKEEVKKSLETFPVETVIQNEQLGTGHAVLCAESAIEEMSGSVMIVCGDTPLIQSETLIDMVTQHKTQKSMLTVMTTKLEDPTHYGRIIEDKDGLIQSIVEEKDATSLQKKIQEINAGIYCIDTKFLFTHLKKIGTDNSQGEVYLTDIVTQAVSEKLAVHKFVNPDPQDVLGVNSRLELSQAHQALQIRRNNVLMSEGATILNPATTQVAPGCTIEKDVTLHPGVEITGNSSISTGSDIKNGAILHNVTVGTHCTISSYACLNDCNITANTIIPQHSHSC